jgi:hypothetical protein
VSGNMGDTQGKFTGRLTIRSLSNKTADIRLMNCRQSIKYGIGTLNMIVPGYVEEMPDMQIRGLAENGKIESVVSSDFAYFNLLFRTPDFIQRPGESETYDIQLHFQDHILEGTGIITLEDYIFVDGQICAKLVHEIQLNSGKNQHEGNYFEITGTINSFFDIEDRIMLLGQLQQTITKHTYEMYEGFYTWVASGHDETITFMKTGLARKLEESARNK